jgi:hypothetical protein
MRPKVFPQRLALEKCYGDWLADCIVPAGQHLVSVESLLQFTSALYFCTLFLHFGNLGASSIAPPVSAYLIPGTPSRKTDRNVVQELGRQSRLTLEGNAV